MCQTLFNELKVTADILLIRPGYKQLGAHWGKKARVYMSMSKDHLIRGISLDLYSVCVCV